MSTLPANTCTMEISLLATSMSAAVSSVHLCSAASTNDAMIDASLSLPMWTKRAGCNQQKVRWNRETQLAAKHCDNDQPVSVLSKKLNRFVHRLRPAPLRRCMKDGTLAGAEHGCYFPAASEQACLHSGQCRLQLLRRFLQAKFLDIAQNDHLAIPCRKAQDR